MIKFFLLTTALLFSLNTFADPGSGNGSNNKVEIKVTVFGKGAFTKKVCEETTTTTKTCTTTTWDDDGNATKTTTTETTTETVPVDCPDGESNSMRSGCSRNGFKFVKSKRTRKIKPNHLRKIAKK